MALEVVATFCFIAPLEGRNSTLAEISSSPITFFSKVSLVPEPSSRLTTVQVESVPVAKMSLTSSMLRLSIGFEGWTTIATPSRAMACGIRSGHLSVSFDLRSREMAPMSKIPPATPLTPALEPPPLTVTSASSYAAAHFSASGWTVVEPPTSMPPPPQPAPRTSAKANTRAIGM